SALSTWHVFIVETDTNGEQWYFRGGSNLRATSGSGSDSEPGGPLAIETEFGVYNQYSRDWYPDAPSITLISGPEAFDSGKCLAQELYRIQELKADSVPQSTNSNTVISTLLANCGLPHEKPPEIWTPGFDSTLGQGAS